MHYAAQESIDFAKRWGIRFANQAEETGLRRVSWSVRNAISSRSYSFLNKTNLSNLSLSIM